MKIHVSRLPTSIIGYFSALNSCADIITCVLRIRLSELIRFGCHHATMLSDSLVDRDIYGKSHKASSKVPIF